MCRPGPVTHTERMVKRYLKIQARLLMYGAIGPLFLVLYFASPRDGFMTPFFWSGLVVTAIVVATAIVMTVRAERSAEQFAALEKTGVLALAEVMGIHETGTHINDQPLVKLDLLISGPGLEPFTVSDRVLAR